ncbi:MAG: hypothetical protein KIT80_09950 [Chitinophagaceae bacterium]|nr:hypothetical protein [Chitinophagaceae bacterium]MCW5927222.1 hypothetical protein [Chitinophagaceae bacterium]
MKKNLLILCLLTVTAALMAWVAVETRRESAQPVSGDIVSCASGITGTLTLNEGGKYVTVLPGSGRHRYQVSTQSDSARLYFNQGITMYYSYHPKEALASFMEAARFDTSCAMLYWGQALALGPGYNSGHNYSMSNEVPGMLQQMDEYKETATAKEQELLEAMTRRYNTAGASDKQRKQLNTDYAAAMQVLAHRYPDDPDILALYIDAMMLVHPWDFWNNDGSPKPWTPELVQLCESILRQDPQHPAGLHYYIHLTEASRHPERALASADSLLALYPGIAHMVHMSSHQYERIGHFEKGVEVNKTAGNNLVEYAALAQGLNLMTRSSHYYAVSTYCAFSGAMRKETEEKSALLVSNTFPSYENTYEQYLRMFPALAKVRLGKWRELLQDTETVPAEWTYAGILSNFARGMAYARTGNISLAEKSLDQLRQKQKDDILKKRFVPHMSSPYECSVVAEHILLANIFFTQGKQNEAIKAIESAIAAEDGLIYTEPKLWMLPARQYLGAFLLQWNQPADAEKAYREDLVWNPGNGWSLLGLYQSLEAQQRTETLPDIKEQYLHSFSGAESLPPGSVY